MFQLLHILGLNIHRHTRTFWYGAFLSISIFAVGLVPAYATTGWWNVGGIAATVPLVSDSYYTNEWTVFSSTGQAYMIYRDVNNGSGATVATLSGETWTTVGDPAFSAGAVVDPRIAISDDGVLYAAYRDEANGGALVTKTFDGTSWVDMGSATFSQTSNIGFWLNLVVDPNGIPYVAFTHSGYLGIYKYVSGAWEPVGATGSISAMSFMAQGVNEQVLTFAPDGTPYLAYMVGGSGFWVKKFDGTAWAGVWSSDGLVETYMDYPALAVVDNNEIYVAYLNKSTDPNWYGTVKKFDGTSWTQVGSNMAYGTYKGIVAPQFAIGTDQTTYLRWRDNLASKDLVYSISGSSLVQIAESLPNPEGGGQPGQLLVNPVTGTLYSPEEVTSGNVRSVGIYEYSDLPTTGSYLGTTINGSGTGTLGSRSLVFDSTGTGYVAYVDYANGRNTTVMKYASGSWSTVGTAGAIPTATGSSYNAPILSVAPDDTPYVYFRDGSNTTVGGKASVMKWDGSAWVYVGSAGFSSGQANPFSMTFSASGTPYITYRDVTTGYVAVRYFDGTTWQNVWPTETIVSYISNQSYLAFAPNGDLYVAMNDLTTNARGTNVLKWNGTAWSQVGTAHIGVYTGNNYASATSMTVGTDGTPYVIASDISTATTYPRMYIWKFDGTNWVKVGSPLGRFISTPRLQISRTGIIYVAYGDTVNRGSSDTPYTYPITIKRLVDDEWVTVGEENFNTSTISAVWPDINPINNLPYVAIVDANSKISVISPLLVLTGSTAVSATLSAGVVSVATPTTIAFPSASVSNAAQILTVSGGTFTVQDLKGANAGYYATISMGNLSSGGNTITAANIAANVSGWVSTVAGNANANVTVPSSAGTLGAGYVALNSANTLVQRSTGGSILGKYSIPLNLRITIPAYTAPGSYAGIMTVTLIEN